MSYGIEQERAAAALTTLITHHPGPEAADTAAAVLRRLPEQLRAAVIERIEILAGVSWMGSILRGFSQVRPGFWGAGCIT